MRKYKAILLLALGLTTFGSANAGNKERAGQAGATQLLINPWGRTAGWGGANSASVTGIEAVNWNVAGLAGTKKLELVFAHTNWMSGSDINLNALGFSSRLGESGGVLGATIQSMSFGDIDRTTVALPEGGLGTYSPQYLTMSISYAKTFSRTISGGITVKAMSEQIADANAQGICLDAGVNYNFRDKLIFGIALRNIGPAMQYEGTGFTERIEVESTGRQISVEQKRAEFELPSLLNIGATYFFLLGSVEETEDGEQHSDHILSVAGTFTSNSFTKDQIIFGTEYAFMKKFMARAGYVYESEITNADLTTNMMVGPTAGATVEVPMSKKDDKGTFGVDFAWRAARNFSGFYTLGVRFDL